MPEGRMRSSGRSLDRPILENLLLNFAHTKTPKLIDKHLEAIYQAALLDQ